MTESDADYQRTKPDFGRDPSQAPAIGEDVIEGVANMGGPQVHWRGGRILYITGFECSINDWVPWLPPMGVGNGLVERFTGNGIQQPMRGSACMHIRSQSVVDPADAIFKTHAINLLPAKWSGRLALAMAIAPGEDSDSTFIDLAWDSNGVTREAGVAFDWPNKDFYYRDTGGWAALWNNYTKIDDIPAGEWRAQAGVSLRWGIVRFLIESDLSEYLGAWINSKFYDLAGVAVPTGVYPITAFERLTIQIIHAGADSTMHDLYIDDCILSQDEPLPDETV